MVGLWMVMQWRQTDRPRVQVIELGPGRATLMTDMLSVFKQFPDFYASIEKVTLVEGGERLTALQKEKLGGSDVNFEWTDRLEELKKGTFKMFVAHEFFDALPIYRFQLTRHGWREILVDLDEEGEEHFRFILAPGETTASSMFGGVLKGRFSDKVEGDQVEVSPEAWALAADVGKHIVDGGCAWIMDYGKDHVQGSTLRVSALLVSHTK
jgi:NADH dehydrogenase [ubiquinone] 1 alpha subcomplex assembly factor 7